MCFKRRKKENTPASIDEVQIPKDEIQEETAKVVTMEDPDFSEKSLEGFYKVTILDEVAYAYVYQPHRGNYYSHNAEVAYYIKYSNKIIDDRYEAYHSRLEYGLKDAQPATREEYESDLKRRFEKIKDKFYQMKAGDVYYYFWGGEHWLYRIESVYKIVDESKTTNVFDDMMINTDIIHYNDYRVLYRQKKITDKDYSEDIISSDIVNFLTGKKEGTGIEYQA